MFKVYFTNHQYHSQEQFNTFKAAKEYGKSRGFNFRIEYRGAIVASWNIISGMKIY